MALDRRSFIRVLGAVGGIAGIGLIGGSAWLMTRTPTGALAPWQAADGMPDAGSDPRMTALARAILSPNPHNRQPWVVALEGDEALDLYCDLDRRLPETDPFDRQVTIGFGCFIELYRLAAAAQGRGLRIEPFPDGEPGDRLDGRRIARLTFDGPGDRDPLIEALPRRRSCKEPFETAREVPASALESLAGAGQMLPVRTTATAAPGQRDALRALTWEAHLREVVTPAKLQESVDLMRIGRGEIEASPDGIDLGGPMMAVLAAGGLVTRSTLADPDSTAFRQGLDLYSAITSSAMAHVWLVTAGNRRADQIAAGRAWMRIDLTAAALGIAIHPLSQALQEYDEMADLHGRAHQLLAPDGGTVQMLGRLGYGPDVPPSPRWPAEAALRSV